MLDTDEVRLMRDLPAAGRRSAHGRDCGEAQLQNAPTLDASGGGTRTARDLVNTLYGATFHGKAVYSALDAYLFRSRLTPKTPRSIASTASGANGTATPGLRDTALSLTSTRSHGCSDKKWTRGTGLG
jgi:hypothetical protein